ncbi:MAG: HNH endonuclease [Aulosira sp. DedQUE10]|nr:HNH endonuclease [Aulosira sp. DedQUE10]
MLVLEQSVVVFSQNYLPLCQVNIKRAIVLLLNLSVEGGWKIHYPSLVLDVPKHIRLKIASGERMWQIPPVNWQAVLRRYHHSCQDCDRNKSLTLDHLIERSQSGSHTWNNVVIACKKCNSYKGNSTPEMHLRTKPKPPVHPAISFAEQFWINMQANLE